MRVLLPKKSVTKNKAPPPTKKEVGTGSPTTSNQSTTERQRPAAKSSTDSLPVGADLSRHMAKLEKEVKDLKKFLGVDSVQTESMGVCPKDGLSGEQMHEDVFSSRKYVHWKDSKGHEWFDEMHVESPG